MTDFSVLQKDMDELKSMELDFLLMDPLMGESPAEIVALVAPHPVVLLRGKGSYESAGDSLDDKEENDIDEDILWSERSRKEKSMVGTNGTALNLEGTMETEGVSHATATPHHETPLPSILLLDMHFLYDPLSAPAEGTIRLFMSTDTATTNPPYQGT
ncbi:hypothetical protein HAX54_014872 [Datura stramonium]|uniref:Uncharacterized protein n=1 Tax=Datura stramonium TaxID=4076 RepID=A0ABS8TPT0_DATST|nr:hypothetical protein [Datura stramonium]